MMKLTTKYTARPIRFLELHLVDGWSVKVYSISSKQEIVNEIDVQIVKKHLKEWLSRSNDTELPTYKIATLIVHEGKEGIFAIVNWWIDENMLQNSVYLKKPDSNDYTLFSSNGICTCVWEMAVWWHERNAWVNHVLKQHRNPQIQEYLNDTLNIDI